MSVPMMIEGRNAVLEALRSGIGVQRILIAEGVQESESLREIEREAHARSIPVELVARKSLERESHHGAHQGVMAEAAPFEFALLDEVLEATEGRARSLVLVLDHVTDPGNLGAVVRSAEVAGADAIVAPSRRSAAVGPAAFKASAGALAHFPLVQETNLTRAIERLKKADYWIAGADGAADTLAWDADLDGRLVLVLGAEGEGLSRLVRESCDYLVRLPVAGRIDSLNVAQAATVLAFEWVRRAGG